MSAASTQAVGSVATAFELYHHRECRQRAGAGKERGGRQRTSAALGLDSREQCAVHGQALGYARVLSLGGQVGELGRLRDDIDEWGVAKPAELANLPTERENA